MPTRRAALSVVLAAAPASGRAETARGADAQALIAGLRQGGHVVVLRHAATDRTQVDAGRLGDRAGQRNLSAAGQAQAAAIGAAWRRHGIPTGEVLSSPVFRAADTAALAFGTAGFRIERRLVADDYEPDPARVAHNAAWLRLRAATPSAKDRTDVLVGHIVPLGLALGRPLSQAGFPEGSLAVLAPGRPGVVLGVLAAADFAEAAAAMR